MRNSNGNIQKKLIKHQCNVPWLNSELKKLLHRKQRLWKKPKFSRDHAKLANYTIPIFHMSKTSQLKTNLKRFWSFVK